jgi:hypothetical protein
MSKGHSQYWEMVIDKLLKRRFNRKKDENEFLVQWRGNGCLHFPSLLHEVSIAALNIWRLSLNTIGQGASRKFTSGNLVLLDSINHPKYGMIIDSTWALESEINCSDLIESFNASSLPSHDDDHDAILRREEAADKRALRSQRRQQQDNEVIPTSRRDARGRWSRPSTAATETKTPTLDNTQSSTGPSPTAESHKFHRFRNKFAKHRVPIDMEHHDEENYDNDEVALINGFKSTVDEPLQCEASFVTTMPYDLSLQCVIGCQDTDGCNGSHNNGNMKHAFVSERPTVSVTQSSSHVPDSSTPSLSSSLIPFESPLPPLIAPVTSPLVTPFALPASIPCLPSLPSSASSLSSCSSGNSATSQGDQSDGKSVNTNSTNEVGSIANVIQDHGGDINDKNGQAGIPPSPPSTPLSTISKYSSVETTTVTTSPKSHIDQNNQPRRIIELSEEDVSEVLRRCIDAVKERPSLLATIAQLTKRNEVLVNDKSTNEATLNNKLTNLQHETEIMKQSYDIKVNEMVAVHAKQLLSLQLTNESLQTKVNEMQQLSNAIQSLFDHQEYASSASSSLPLSIPS